MNNPLRLLSALAAACLLFTVFAPAASGQSRIRAGDFTEAEWTAVRAAHTDIPATVLDQWRPLVHPRSTHQEPPPSELGNQTLAALGYVDVTAAPFFADKSGATDTTAALQAAINFARDYRMVAFLPAGDYRVSDTIHLRQLHSIRTDTGKIDWAHNEYFNVVHGSTASPAARARIVLADNAPGFNDPANPKIVVRIYNTALPSATGTPDVEVATNHYNQTWRSVDITVGSGNSGAVGLYARGAEGSLVQDVTINATGGDTGLWGPPASGGSTIGLTVLGGRIGVETRNFPGRTTVGVQPSPTITGLTLVNQSDYALAALVRGALVVVGAEILTNRPGPVIVLDRHWAGQPYDSSLSLIDSVIRYSTPNSANTLIFNPASNRARSYTFHDVFVENAVATDPLSATPATASGWHRFNTLAVHRKPALWNEEWSERIHLDGAPHSSDVLNESATGVAPPADLLSRHRLAVGRLPSVESPGVVSITAHGASTSADDNTAAIQAALNAADVVLVPRGDYFVRDPLSLRGTNKLFGVHPLLSELLAKDEPARRFGLNPSPSTSGIPLLSTPDSATAAPVVSSLGIRSPNTLRQHAALDVGVYPLLWRSGRDSVLHHIYYNPYFNTNYRLETVYRTAQSGGGLGLGQIAKPHAAPSGLTFTEQGLLNWLLVEKFGSDLRLATRTNRDRFGDVGLSNLTVTRSGGGSFDLTSVDLANATFDDVPGFAVTVTGHLAAGGTVTHTHTFSGSAPRASLFPVALNWTGLSSVVITAPRPFAIDNVASSVGFESFGHLVAPTSSIAFWSNDKRRTFDHYPYAAIVHPQVQVTGSGGGRFFSFFHHGDIWAQDNYRQVVVRDNTEPLHIYHWHLQHIRSDAEAELRNARFVSVYGVKHEHCSRFLDVIDSDHIRIFGQGGLSDANAGESHVFVQNTPNWLLSALADEIHRNQDGVNIYKADNPLVQWDPSLYDGVQELWQGQLFAAAVRERPILTRRGSPLSQPPPVPAAAPSALAASAVSTSSISLAWADNSADEDGFELEFSASGGAFAALASVPANTTSHLAENLSPQTGYSFRVRSLKGGLVSAWSATASATTPTAIVNPPAAPQSFAGSAVGSDSIALTWADIASDETAYQLQQSLLGGAFTTLPNLPANSTGHTITGLLPSTAYVFRLKAINSAGSSSWTPTITVVTAAVGGGAVNTAIIDYSGDTNEPVVASWPGSWSAGVNSSVLDLAAGPSLAFNRAARVLTVRAAHHVTASAATNNPALFFADVATNNPDAFRLGWRRPDAGTLRARLLVLAPKSAWGQLGATRAGFDSASLLTLRADNQGVDTVRSVNFVVIDRGRAYISAARSTNGVLTLANPAAAAWQEFDAYAANFAGIDGAAVTGAPRAFTDIQAVGFLLDGEIGASGSVPRWQIRDWQVTAVPHVATPGFAIDFSGDTNEPVVASWPATWASGVNAAPYSPSTSRLLAFARNGRLVALRGGHHITAPAATNNPALFFADQVGSSNPDCFRLGWRRPDSGTLRTRVLLMAEKADWGALASAVNVGFDASSYLTVTADNQGWDTPRSVNFVVRENGVYYLSAATVTQGALTLTNPHLANWRAFAAESANFEAIDGAGGGGAPHTFTDIDAVGILLDAECGVVGSVPRWQLRNLQVFATP